MISNRAVGYLGTLTLAMVIAAAIALVARHGDTIGRIDTQRAVPGFADRAAAVTSIRIRRAGGAGDAPITIERRDGAWGMAERDFYPARPDHIRKLLVDIGELTRIEAKTSDPDRYHRLHLRDIADPDSKAVQITLNGSDGSTLFDALFGKRRSDLAGKAPMIYMRGAGDAQSWLVQGDLDLRGRPADWIRREIANIPRDRIALVRFDGPAGPVELRRVEGGKDFTPLDIPPGRERKSRYSSNNAAGGLQTLEADDVRRADRLSFDPALGQTLFQTLDGLTITIDFAAGETRTGRDRPDIWCRFAVSLAEEAGEEARALAAELQERLDGWAFRPHDSRLNRLRETMESLTRPQG